MSDWIEQYSSALDERDACEQAHQAYIDAFTKLADRTASSAAKSSSTTTSSPQPIETRIATPTRGKAAAAELERSSTDVPTLRADLAATQKARAALQAQVEELTSSLQALQTQNKASTSQITQLTRQKTDTERKLRDREEEIRGKSRLVTEAQDEMVALELQLNMAEKASQKLKQDNKELLDRWMKLKGQEVDKMNKDSRWE